MSKVLLVTNAEWYFLSHRVALARALQRAGHDVVIAAEVEQGKASEIEDLGFRFVRIPLSRRSTRPTTELSTIRALYALYRSEMPAVVHHITIKPVIYGSLVARRVGIPVIVNTIPGLGYMFTGTGTAAAMRRRFALSLYRLALRGRNVRAVFQNSDDRALFVNAGAIDPKRAMTVLGSGVDLDAFAPVDPAPGMPLVVLPGRLLWDKGIREMVEAARLLRARRVRCRIAFVGRPDSRNPSSVDEDSLRKWVSEGLLEWWGYQEDMAAVMRAAHIVVLPSYREGVPKALLEAAAAGRPIVTTDVPGCREVVIDGVNGILVPPRDASALANAIERLVDSPELREKMGAAGRIVAETRFGDVDIALQTVAVYSLALS